MKKTHRQGREFPGTLETGHALIQRGASESMPMTKYSDYTEWDSRPELRENESAEYEAPDPFDDPEVRRRMGELISRAGYIRRAVLTAVRRDGFLNDERRAS